MTIKSNDRDLGRPIPELTIAAHRHLIGDHFVAFIRNQ